MSTQPELNPENLARRWFEEVWNLQRDDTVLELAADDCLGHLEGGRNARGPAEFLEARRELLETFPDLNIQVDDVLADDHRAVVRWSVTGTHRGERFGPPTGRQHAWRGMTWLEMANGRITCGWDSWNLGGLLLEMRSDEEEE